MRTSLLWLNPCTGLDSDSEDFNFDRQFSPPMHRPVMYISQRHGPTWCGGGCNCPDRHIQTRNIENENQVLAAARYSWDQDRLDWDEELGHFENPLLANSRSFQDTFDEDMDEDTDSLAALFSPVRLPSQPTTSLSVSSLRSGNATPVSGRSEGIKAVSSSGVPGTLSQRVAANPACAARSIGNRPKEQQRGSSRFSERCVATSTKLQASALPAASTHEEFAEELVCSICLELLRKPVLLLCGHSFCQSCIDTVCKDKETCPCPVCRQMFEKGKYIKIVALDSLAEKVREGTPLRNSGKKPIAPLLARDAPKLKDHRLLPTQDAVLMLKDEPREDLATLNVTRKKSLAQRKSHDRRMDNHLDRPRAGVGAVNATRRKFLDQRKSCGPLMENHGDQPREGLVTLNVARRKCLDQRKNYERLIANHKDQPRDALVTTNQAGATVTKGKSLGPRKSRDQLIEVHQWELSSIASVFERLHVALTDRKVTMVDEQQIHEAVAKKSMEDCFIRLQEDCRKAWETLGSAKKYLDQEDPLEFLKLRRYCLGCVPSYSGTTSSKLKGIKSFLEKCSTEYIGRDPATEVSRTPSQLLPKDLINYATWKLLKYSLCPAPSQLTLDPNSAHCELNVSGDHTSVWYSGAKRWLWDDRKRFYEARAVLASKGFISGEHYWEVHMGKAASWVIGVAEESINREDEVPLVPSSGLWVLALGQCKAFQRLGTAKTSSKVVSSISRSQKVGVYLDYEHGVLSFYNATNMSRIHSLHFLTKSRLFPYFHFSGDVTKGKSELLTLFY